MSRLGFDQKIHPYHLQLRVCCFPDFQGIQNRSSINLNFQEGIITNYHTHKSQISTTIREYIASDDELKELYSFFTFDAIREFESMTENEKKPFNIGYYDWASLRYLLIGKEGQLSDGVRHSIYSNDPIQIALRWMHKVSPFDLD